MIPIVVGALETVPKGLKNRQGELGVRKRLEIIETTALLRSARILRRVIVTLGDSSEKRKTIHDGNDGITKSRKN